MELSIIVPCYNEAKNLDRLVSVFREAIGERSGVEIVLVDNGSRDDTPAKLQTLLSQPENRFARSVRVEVNQGYGYGILFGLHRSAGTFLAWTHADLQTPPEDVLHAWETIRAMPDPKKSLVRGNRKGRPLFDQFFTTAMGWFASYALHSQLYDVNAQPKVFHRSLLTQMKHAPHDFTLDLYLLFLANQLGLHTRAFDVQFNPRIAGDAKGGGTLAGKYKLSMRTLSQVWNLRRSLGKHPFADTLVSSSMLAEKSEETRKVA